MPNGYGSISILTGKRRKPYRVQKTIKRVIGENGKSKQIRQTIGYFETREQAMQALANYNQNPYDIETDSITFEEVYEEWSKGYFPTLSNNSSVRTITAAYKYCKPIYKMRFKDIRVNHLEGVIADAQVGDSTKARIKSMFNMLYRFALSREIADKDYAQLMFANGNPIKRERTKDPIPFTADELTKIWENLDEVPFVDMILIAIYSGWRPQELSILKVEDIDLEKNTMKGGLKTDAGKNRIVPIHSAIRPLIEKRLSEAKKLNSDYLFNDINGQQGTHMTYDKYRSRWNKAMKRLNMEHHPHEARHTFITLGKAAGMDEYILKLIVGHAIQDITEAVYTHRTLEQLQTEIEKIKK
jgi:integrase